MPGRGRGRPPHPDILTPAEQRVLEELRRGGTNVEIAVRLGRSTETVRTHIASMLSKLDLADRHELAAWRQDRDRKRLLGLLALPPTLGSIGRPLVWVGVALGGLASLAVVVVLLVVFLVAAEDDRAVLSPPAGPGSSSTPLPGGDAEAPNETAGAPATPADTPTVTPNPSPTVACRNPSPAPDLVMFSDGAATELVIEWTGGPADTTGWQYRTRLWGGGTRHPEQGWGARREDTTTWTDIPTSAATTCSYRITGLKSRWSYEAQVRATLPGGAHGVESNVADGSTQYDDGRAPKISPDVTVKGDGSTRWHIHQLGWTIIIPDGMLIRGGRASINVVGVVGIYDHESGSSLGFSIYGHELGRRVVLQPRRDVVALFDQIVASVDPPVQPLTPAQYAVGWGIASGDTNPVGDDVVHIDTSRGGVPSS